MSTEISKSLDFSDLARFPESARMALVLAAVGRLDVLFVGPAGTGKTMLARRLQGILPDLTEAERAELARTYEQAKLGTPVARPFRAPHHSISWNGMIGKVRIGNAGLAQQTIPREPSMYWQPGELALAHAGALFLDELPEFNRTVLDEIFRTRNRGVIGEPSWKGTWLESAGMPARFQIVATANACECGRSETYCACDVARRVAYRSRLFQLSAHFDVVVELTPWTDEPAQHVSTTEEVRDWVSEARTAIASVPGRHSILDALAALDGRTKGTDTDRAHAKEIDTGLNPIVVESVTIQDLTRAEVQAGYRRLAHCRRSNGQQFSCDPALLDRGVVEIG